MLPLLSSRSQRFVIGHELPTFTFNYQTGGLFVYFFSALKLDGIVFPFIRMFETPSRKVN
jgi:hypothetical protein